LEKDMNLLAKIGLLGLLAGGTASALYADPAGGWLSPNGVSGAGPASTSGAAQGATGQSGAASVALPAVEIQARVQVFVEQTHADARRILHLQQLARKEKDVIKLNCVNDKLVQVKPEMNIVDHGVAELQAATDANRMSVFEGISAAAENIRHLREEADQCIGEPVQTGGDSSNSFTGPDVPDDPTKGFGGPELEPPGYASPYN
jgi:hypothetical protein